MNTAAAPAMPISATERKAKDMTQPPLSKTSTVTVALMSALLVVTASGAFAFASHRTAVLNLEEGQREIKASIQQMRSAQSTLALVMERMRQDDERERKDAALFDDHEARLRKLENGK